MTEQTKQFFTRVYPVQGEPFYVNTDEKGNLIERRNPDKSIGFSIQILAWIMQKTYADRPDRVKYLDIRIEEH